MEECARLNEDLSQSQVHPININFNDEPNDSPAPSYDQSQNDFDNCSSPNPNPQNADESFISEDERNLYVSCF